jgi:hypothetical protein
MATTTQNGMADVMTMWTSTFLDVPLANAQWSWGMGQARDVEGAVWKGYDAWVRIANAAIDNAYKHPLFGELLATALDRGLRWQHWSQTIASTVAASVAPVTGLPTAAMLDSLQEDVHALTAHLSAQDAQLRAVRAEIRELSTDRVAPRKVSSGGLIDRDRQVPPIAAPRPEHHPLAAA